MLQRNNTVSDHLRQFTIDMICYFFFHRSENSNILVSVYGHEVRQYFGHKRKLLDLTASEKNLVSCIVRHCYKATIVIASEQKRRICKGLL